MFFEIEGKTYGVMFTKNGRTTYAVLHRISEHGATPTEVIGIATMYYKDKSNDSIGEKAALSDLLFLMNIFYLEEISSEGGNKEHLSWNMTKEIRARIWEEYFKTHKK